MRKFELNGKEYKAKEFSFNTVCELEDCGFSMGDMQKKPMSMVRSYLSICLNISLEEAGKEMEEHIVSGGDFEEIMKVIMEEMRNSDFFQNLNKRAKEESEKQEEEAAE